MDEVTLRELEEALRDEMLAFGAKVSTRRPDVRFTVEQPPSIHYASTTLLSFLWDKSEDDLVVAGSTLDLRTGSPVWSIDIVLGDGAPIAEDSVPQEVASKMVASPSVAREHLACFLTTNLEAVVDALPHVTFRGAD
jgi:hypothetical protein